MPLSFLAEPGTAVVFGAGGGLGAAFVEALAAEPGIGRVLAVARSGAAAPTGAPAHQKVVPATADVTDEASIAACARQIRCLGTPRVVVVASGILHSSAGAGTEPIAATKIQPEKNWGALDADVMMKVFAINAIGPALIAKHFLPLLPRGGKSVFAAISARVGSISDNRLGGWYSYRASKAALNMLIRTLSIELARRAPEAVCIGLHPGTVDTALSRPFHQRVEPHKLFTPAQSVAQLMGVIDRVRPDDTGNVFAWDGSRVAA